jgi:hypothetical protein
MNETHDVVASFVDGEMVDPTRLSTALADAGARAYLIDLLALRGLVRGDAAVRPARSASSSGHGPGRWWPAAAVIALTSAAAGYLAGAQTASFQPAPGELSARPRPPLATMSVPAPQPTSVIRFEPGVDWEERTGGS